MNNIIFKIFGAPYVFDLYQSSGGESGYFLNFDNGSKENTKLTIHRMASGKVSYSYLRYNFITSGGRPNSFFGMSVVFDNEYCKDIQKIFELFDAIYKGVILKNGILITELNGNPTAQAKYLVRTFAEAEGEVKNIENNIINNLKTHFAKDILPLDSSFLESNSMVKLNDKMGNTAFVSALKKCSWVNISEAYSTNEEPIPNPEFLAALDGTIEDVQKQIPVVSVRALKQENVQREVYALLTGIQNSLGKIDVWLKTEYKLPKGATNLNPYLQKQPELKERREKLLEIQKPLNDLCDVVKKTDTDTLPPTQTPDGTGNNDLKPNWLKEFYTKYKSVIWGIAVVAGIVVLVVIFLKNNNNNNNKSIPPPIEDTAAVEIKIESENIVDSLQYWWDKALAADSAKKYSDAIMYLDKANIYNNGRYGVDELKKEIQKKIEDAEKAEQKRKDDATKKKTEEERKKVETTTKPAPTPASDDCYVSYQGRTQKASVWISALQEELDKKRGYDYVIGCCTIIMNNCPQNKEAAKSLQERAKTAKAEINVNNAFKN